MSSQPVALDFTKMEPITPQGGPVALDFTKMEPLNGQASAPAAAAAPEQSMLSKVGQLGMDVQTGIGKGIADTAGGLAKFIHSATGLPINPEFEQRQTQTGATNPGELIGKAMENVGEFMAGDEGLKALAIGEKLKLLHGISEAMGKFPVIAQIIGGAARTAAVSGVQQAAKTGSLEEGAKAAGEGAVLGAAGETVGEGLKTLHTSAAAESRVASVGDKVLQKYAKTFGATAPVATSLGDAADKIKGIAKEKVFKVLDQVSDGEFGTLQNTINKAKAVSKRASSYADLTDAEYTIKSSEDRILKLIDANKDQLSPESYTAARAAWKDASVLDKVDRAVDGAFNMPEDAAKLTGDSRVMKGNIGKRLNTLIQRIPVEDLDRTLGPDGTKNLYTIARENSSPIVDALAQEGFLGKTAKTAQDARRLAVHFLIANPRAGRMFTDAIRIGASPKVVVPAILSAMRPAS